VPRLRLETRGGEVSKGVTVRNRAVIDAARQVVHALPGARGVLNIQIFYDEVARQANVIEINPRFGGGYPLTHQAGAPMATWLLEEALGLPCSARDDQWREGVVMLRYDDAVFVDAADVGVPLPGQGDQVCPEP
jgi:carbamoyl-phosphate synthase large subunit